MRNVVFEDNQNIGEMNEKLVVLGMDVDAGFERFALDYIGYMTFKEIRSYTAGYVKFIGEHRKEILKVFSPQNLLRESEITFQSLFEFIENSLELELAHVRTAINNKPEAKKCWIKGKEVICKMMNAFGTELDEVLRHEIRLYQRLFEKHLNRVSSIAGILETTYGRCKDPRLDDRPEDRKKCAELSVRVIKRLIHFYYFLFTLLDEGEKQIVFA